MVDTRNETIREFIRQNPQAEIAATVYVLTESGVEGVTSKIVSNVKSKMRLQEAAQKPVHISQQEAVLKIHNENRKLSIEQVREAASAMLGVEIKSGLVGKWMGQVEVEAVSINEDEVPFLDEKPLNAQGWKQCPSCEKWIKGSRTITCTNPDCQEEFPTHIPDYSRDPGNNSPFFDSTDVTHLALQEGGIQKLTERLEGMKNDSVIEFICKHGSVEAAIKIVCDLAKSVYDE